MSERGPVVHATTILSVRQGGHVTVAGDGQVSLGDMVVKQTACKVRRLYNDRVLVGFAGTAADAFALFAKFEAKLEEFNGNLPRAAVEQMEEQVKSASEQLTSEKKHLEQLESVLLQLEPVKELDIDIAALRNSHYTYSMLGLIPAANIDRLQTSLARVPNVFLTLRSDSAKPVVWLAGPQSNADVLSRAAKSAYLDPLTLPEGYEGKPSKIIESLHTSIEQSKQKIEELKNTLAQFANQHGAELRLVESDNVHEALSPLVGVLLLTEVNYRTGRWFDIAEVTAAIAGHGHLAILVVLGIAIARGLRYGILGVSDVPVGLSLALLLGLTVALYFWAITLLNRGVGIRK